MELRIKHKANNGLFSMIYNAWINDIVNKGEASEYIILEYPDIVQIVHIEPSGNRLNYKITDRRLAKKIVDDSPQAFELVEIDVKRQFVSDIKLSDSIANKMNGKNHLSFKPFFFFLSFLLLVPMFSKSVRIAIKRYIDVNINVITVIVGIISILLAIMTIILTNPAYN